MSLWTCARSIKDKDRELSIYQSGGLYDIRYKNGNQRTWLKSNVIDIGYANYLFDMYSKDLHMEENLTEYEYDINHFEEKIKKYHKSLMENKGSNMKTKINLRSSDICSLIKLQSKITEILLEDYGEFKIADHIVDDFIENQRDIRKCIGSKEYSKTEYGNEMDKLFVTEEKVKDDKVLGIEIKKIIRDVAMKLINKR